MATLSRLVEVETSEVKGLAGKRSAALSKAGIESVADLLHHVPRRYIDRTRKIPIAETEVGGEVTVIGEITKTTVRRPRRNLAIVESWIADESGSIKAVWFNQTFRKNQLREGSQVAFSGVVERFRGGLQMKSPAADVLDSPSENLVTGRIVPVHSSVGDVSPGVIRRAIHNALLRSRPVEDPLPLEFLAPLGLMGRDEAFADVHFPDTPGKQIPARRRLVYDEFFRLELSLAMQKRRQIDEADGIAHKFTGDLVDRFLSGLPYTLTRDQTKVLQEIEGDLTEAHPMHRLLQGEVGSGKTVVAVTTLLRGIEGGWQGAIMAPTEVLAEQHYMGVTALLAEAGLSPDLQGGGSDLGMDSLFAGDGPAVHLAILTGSIAAANYRPGITRAELLVDVSNGQVDLLVGTHALIQEGVTFDRLGIAVIDEQHRFGVSQRVDLKAKANEVDPDLLIMTATPIPRTYTMTLYGDLDVSQIVEMPPGRSPVATTLLDSDEEAIAWKKVTEEVEAGRQAFVVCPLVEDSSKIQAASAVAEHERLSALMSDLKVGLIHGQLKSVEKEHIMAEFRAGEIEVLVSTTVIEVGIDVPNATVMVIEDADRFGLSQLHQLRGRVGRGEDPGFCLLLASPTTPEGEERLRAMASTTDGFALAEIDLEIRGQGTVFGNRQSGAKDLKIADVVKDSQLLISARRDAFSLVAGDPELEDHPELAEEVKAMLGEDVEWLFKS